MNTLLKEKQELVSLSLLELLDVEASFTPPHPFPESFSHSLKALQLSIRYSIPASTLQLFHKNKDNPTFNPDLFFLNLIENSPIVSWSKSENSAPYTISVRTICSSNNTHGVGRFTSDICSRWLIPGKQLPIVYLNSMAFKFKRYKKYSFFSHQLFLTIDNEHDLQILEKNMPALINELRLTILSVQHARKVISSTNLTFAQKQLIIQENIVSLLVKSSHSMRENVFDHVHNFVVKISADNKVSMIKEELTPLLELKPQIFNRDLFNELQHYITSFHDQFLTYRSPKHLARIITYRFLFKKTLSNQVLTHPTQRHLSIKILRSSTKDSSHTHPIIGILIAINLFRENEIFDTKHILTAVGTIIAAIRKVKYSEVHTPKSDSTIKILYVEIEKESLQPFDLTEISALKKKLPREIKSSIESVINPIFMPRNEEEVMKYILTLSGQLQYIHDIPQIILSFYKQTSQRLTFTIILLRLRFKDAPTLKHLLSTHKKVIKITNHETRIVGKLRKKHLKEANVFEVQVEKKPFLRKDFSVDLYQARQYIFQQLTVMIGELRDYNGGMISKQTENLTQIKALLKKDNINNDFLIATYFHSIKPTYMQSLMKPKILQKALHLYLEALEYNYDTQPFYIQSNHFEKQLIILISAANPSFRKFISDKLETMISPSKKLVTSFVNIYDIPCLTFIIADSYEMNYNELTKSLHKNLLLWHDTVEAATKQL